MNYHYTDRFRRCLRAAGFTVIGLALVAGLTLSWLAPMNGGWLVALLLVCVGILLVKMAEGI